MQLINYQRDEPIGEIVVFAWHRLNVMVALLSGFAAFVAHRHRINEQHSVLRAICKWVIDPHYAILLATCVPMPAYVHITPTAQGRG